MLRAPAMYAIESSDNPAPSGVACNTRITPRIEINIRAINIAEREVTRMFIERIRSTYPYYTYCVG
jgi:hypothetical protein